MVSTLPDSGFLRHDVLNGSVVLASCFGLIDEMAVVFLGLFEGLDLLGSIEEVALT